VLMLVAAACVLLAWRLGGLGTALSKAGDAAILAARPDRLLLLRYAPAPRIVVAIFPSLHAQAQALNRAAIFLEAQGVPRDRAPDDAAVDRAIAAAHQTYDRFYYGHDYRATDLHRLWALEDKGHVTLDPAEQGLRRALLRAESEPAGFGAVISLPPAGDGLQDDAGRAAILRHELSHGRYFTDAAYAASVRTFWQTSLSPSQRAAFRRFLAGGFYDSSNEDLMANEAQAYLCNTPDARFFRPADVGLTEEQQAFLCRGLAP